MTIVELLFLLLGAIAVGSALLVVTTRQLVHAALWLVVTLGALAGCYLLLSAELVAWVQVLIYVGAVVVLLLFGLMLTRAPVGPSDDLDSGNRLLAAAVAAATAGVLGVLVVRAMRDASIDLEASGARAGTAGEIGAALFRNWVLPFEVLSVLLLAALVGAIVLSQHATTPSAPPGPAGPAGPVAPPGEAGEAAEAES
jgi:NADH-quinone oxidoreductase subunit J